MELNFLVETKKLLETNPAFTEGRIKLYVNKFGKPYNVSRKEFFGLLQTAENQVLEREFDKMSSGKDSVKSSGKMNE